LAVWQSQTARGWRGANGVRPQSRLSGWKQVRRICFPASEPNLAPNNNPARRDHGPATGGAAAQARVETGDGRPTPDDGRQTTDDEVGFASAGHHRRESGERPAVAAGTCPVNKVHAWTEFAHNLARRDL
jgi:hypothetical protein